MSDKQNMNGKNYLRRLAGIKKTKSKNANKNYKRNKRQRILNKTNGKCYICGYDLIIEKMTIEHFIPVTKGGSNNISNLLPA
ncbi:MAG: HNH endonuclease signature motif containing protein [Nanoarchaeota archaeon]